MMGTTPSTGTQAKRSEPRERLLATASEIFYAEGIHQVGVDRIIAAAGVTKATFYRHYPSKEDLVLAYLDGSAAKAREDFEAAARSIGPVELLRVVAGEVAETLRGPGFRGCGFINAAAEYSDPASPVRRLVESHRSWFHSVLTDAFTRAGHPNPSNAAEHFSLIRDGAMVSGNLSDPAAAGVVMRRGVEGLILSIEERRWDP